jgi:AcrR family transcriptional regulator
MSVRGRKPAEERKSQIIKAALELTAEMGPGRVTTEALARAVGITQPGIFRHFPKKSDIWKAVAQRIGALLRESQSAGQNEGLADSDPLGNFVAGHLRFLQDTPAVPALLFSRELHAENDDLRVFFAGLVQNGHAFLTRIIAGEVEAGRYDKALEAEDAAYLVLALVQGLAMRWSLEGQHFDLVAEGRRLLALQTAGFKARSG